MTIAVSTCPTLVLLPGMDGTGRLFRGLTQAIPADWPHRVISYPCNRVMNYGQILQLVENELAGETRIILLAESYSGPVALRFAAAHSSRVAAVVLCASFIRPPISRWLRWVVGSWMFRLRAPKFALRALMLGRNAPDAIVNEVRAAIASVRPKVLAFRVKDVLSLDCSEALRTCTAPVMYLAGTQDVLVRRASIEAISAIKGDVKLSTVEGPHLLLQREPLKAWNQIEAFLHEAISRDTGRARSR